jgi:hypothetical protein
MGLPECARITVSRTSSGDAITYTYTWEGAESLPVAISRELLESGFIGFPDSWNMLAVESGHEDVRFYYRAAHLPEGVRVLSLEELVKE